LDLSINVNKKEEESSWRFYVKKNYEYVIDIKDEDINSLFERGSLKLRELLLNRVFKAKEE
jgi:hypothetical protein